MFATPGSKRSTNDSSLKTTTWGARLALLTLIALLTAGLSLANGKKPKLSKDLDALKTGHGGTTVDVIIQFNQVPTAAHHKKVQNKGGVLRQSWTSSKAPTIPFQSKRWMPWRTTLTWPIFRPTARCVARWTPW